MFWVFLFLCSNFSCFGRRCVFGLVPTGFVACLGLFWDIVVGWLFCCGSGVGGSGLLFNFGCFVCSGLFWVVVGCV